MKGYEREGYKWFGIYENVIALEEQLHYSLF